LIAALALWLAGCAGHEIRVEAALKALNRGSPEQAVAALNEELEVDKASQLPRDVAGDNALLILDRATILQSLDDYKLSARDFGVADKQIDMLDLQRGTADEIGKYLFSDDVGPYRAPPFEKLLINTFNGMNYLAMRDLSGARVEARRLAVIQRYLKDQKISTTLLGLGSYLAGFAYEKSGRYREALTYYNEALQYATYSSLRDPLRVLTRGDPYSPRVDALVAGMGPLDSVGQTGESEILVVVGYGRVPQKKPVRLPIGLALTIAAGSLSPHDSAQANKLAAKGLVTWVNFPRLGKSRGSYSIPRATLDNRAITLEHALDVEAEVRREWEENEGTIVASAIVRMIARVVAGEVVSAATNAASGDKAGIAGLLAGLETSGAMAAADTPDTRSWTTLPSQVAIARMRVRPGLHYVQISARGATKTYKVEVAPRDWAFICMTSLR